MSQSLFTSQTPSIANASDGTPGITTATTERAVVAGSITHVRFFATATVGGTYTVEVWEPTNDDAAPAGTLLATKVMAGVPTGGAWNAVALDTPVARLAGQPFRVAVHNSQGRYVATLGFFSVDLGNGDLIADADGDDPFLLGAMRQGVFAISATAGAYPSSGNGTCYFVDVVFDVATTPVAVADSAAETETATASVTAAAADTATFTDTAAPAIAAATADTASVDGTVTAAVNAATVDIAAVADAPTVDAAVLWADAASLAELQALAVAAAFEDLAAVTHALANNVIAAAADGSVVTETITIDIPGQSRPAAARHYSGAQRAAHYSGPQTVTAYRG